ncbi:MAG: hypothetical protein EOP17_10260 [Rhizobiaceae bacterium]|nr:MAG: hypothetical protein EOP17_10260 [Rhizobiaceae bacterium]
MSDPFDFGKEERKLLLVHNERTKLRANALDRLSSASVAAGFIAPIASMSNNGVTFGISVSIVASTTAWIFTALVLHFAAQLMLGKQRP